MHRVVHFEIQVDDPDRAMKFYSDVFDWTFEQWENSGADYWMVMTAPEGSEEMGINGGMMRRTANAPALEQGANAFVCTLMADDFEATSEKILAAGGQVALPKYALQGMAWQGYFVDTEGNTFGIHQIDINAA